MVPDPVGEGPCLGEVYFRPETGTGGSGGRDRIRGKRIPSGGVWDRQTTTPDRDGQPGETPLLSTLFLDWGGGGAGVPRDKIRDPKSSGGFTKSLQLLESLNTNTLANKFGSLGWVHTSETLDLR